jgi:chromosome segregation ATPase
VKAHYTRPSTGIEQAIAAPILIPIQMVDAILRKILGLEDLDARKEELLSCNKAMREAWDLFGEHKADLLPADKAQIYKTLSDAQARLDAAWADYKDESNRLFRLKQEAWERRQKEREEKHQQFVERVNANIEKLEGNLGKAKDALERNENRLEKLREDYENAWSDSFKERCSGWIDECEEKVRDIQSSIERLEGWLDEERSKLR